MLENEFKILTSLYFEIPCLFGLPSWRGEIEAIFAFWGKISGVKQVFNRSHQRFGNNACWNFDKCWREGVYTNRFFDIHFISLRYLFLTLEIQENLKKIVHNARMIFVLYHILNDFLIIIYICSFTEFQQFSLQLQ